MQGPGLEHPQSARALETSAEQTTLYLAVGGRLSRLPHLPEEQQEAQGEKASPSQAVSTRPGP